MVLLKFFFLSLFNQELVAEKVHFLMFENVDFLTKRAKVVSAYWRRKQGLVLDPMQNATRR